MFLFSEVHTPSSSFVFISTAVISTFYASSTWIHHAFSTLFDKIITLPRLPCVPYRFSIKVLHFSTPSVSFVIIAIKATFVYTKLTTCVCVCFFLLHHLFPSAWKAILLYLKTRFSSYSSYILYLCLLFRHSYLQSSV